MPGDRNPDIEKLSAKIAALQTENKRLKANYLKCRKCQDYFQVAFSFSPESLCLTRLNDGEFIAVNKEFLKRTGYTEDEIIAESSVDIEFWEDPDDRIKLIDALKENGMVADLDSRFRYRDGQVRYVRISARIIEINSVPHILTVVKDIHSEKLQADSQRAEYLEHAEILQFLDNIIDTIPDPIFVKDEEHRWIILNSAFCEFMGNSKEELLGKSDHDFFPESEARVFWEKDDEVFRSGKVVFNEELLTDSSGETHVIETKKAVFKDRNNNRILVGIIRDITNLKRLEEERLRSSKLESIGLLAGGIAHDFNNILTGILGYINIAGKLAAEDTQVFDLLGKAESASIRAKDLTRQLLTFSKGGEPITSVIQVEDLIRESTELVLRGTHISSQFEIPPDIWPVEVDAGQIGQVINNLVINAVQSMINSGTVFISCENTYRRGEFPDFLTGDRYVRIAVRDEGVGISKAELPKVFDPYFTTKNHGSGLGLATSYSIVSRHKGYISLDSKPGQGTTAVIYLPASDKAVMRETEFDDKLYMGTGRILVMDDESMVREATGYMLQELGYELDFAENGAESIEKYSQAAREGNPFKLVIMDLTIPGGMGGAEAISLLKEQFPDVKSIVTSGYSNDPILANFQAYGFQGYLPKPYKTEELGKVLHDILG